MPNTLPTFIPKNITNTFLILPEYIQNSFKIHSASIPNQVEISEILTLRCGCALIFSWWFQDTFRDHSGAIWITNRKNVSKGAQREPTVRKRNSWTSMQKWMPNKKRTMCRNASNMTSNLIKKDAEMSQRSPKGNQNRAPNPSTIVKKEQFLKTFWS